MLLGRIMCQKLLETVAVFLLGFGEEVSGVSNYCKAHVVYRGKCRHPKDVPSAHIGPGELALRYFQGRLPLI